MRHRATPAMLCLSIVLSAVAFANAAETPASAPAAKVPAATTQAALQAVEQWISHLGDEKFNVRTDSQQAIVALHRAYVEALTAAAESADPAAVKAIGATLEKMELRLGAEALVAETYGPRQQQLLQLLKLQPQWLEQVARRDSAATVAVLTEVGKLKDPNHPAAGLVALCLDDPRPEIIHQALLAIAAVPFGSESIVDALTDLIGRAPAKIWDDTRPWHTTPAWDAVKALAKIGSPRPAPRLLALYTQVTRYSSHKALGDAMIATGELRLLPTLMDLIEGTGGKATYQGGGKQIEATNGDTAIFVILGLTGQKVEDYGMIVSEVGGNGTAGFAKDEARQAAIGKLKEWWEKNKAEGKYKDLKPLDLPPPVSPPAEGEK